MSHDARAQVRVLYVNRPVTFLAPSSKTEDGLCITKIAFEKF